MVSRTMTVVTKDSNLNRETITVPVPVSTTATYQQFGTCGRALVSLSNNSYNDTLLTQVISVSEELDN